MRWICALAATAALALLGCGTTDDSPDDPFAAAKELIAKTAYLPAFQRCMIKGAEQQVSSTEIDELSSEPEDQQLKASIHLLEPVALKCKEATKGPIVDPQATSAELAPIKDLTARGGAIGAEDAGVTSAQARCIERQIKAMSDDEFVEFANAASAKAQESQILPAVKACVTG
jgi:hypothetical protein